MARKGKEISAKDSQEKVNKDIKLQSKNKLMRCEKKR